MSDGEAVLVDVFFQRHVGEFGFVHDQGDRLAFHDLVANRVHVPLLIESRPNSASGNVLLAGEQFDMHIEFSVAGFQFMFLSDAFQDEMFFEGLLGTSHQVMLQSIHMHADLIVGESARLQLQNGSLQLTLGLPFQHGLGQFPVR